MAVKIRMARHGAHKSPFYRIVAADSRSPRDGRFIEQLGYYNPGSEELKVDRELVLKWLKQGAKPSETVKGLLGQLSIMEEFHCIKSGQTFKGSTERKKTVNKYKERKLSKKAIAKKAEAAAE